MATFVAEMRTTSLATELLGASRTAILSTLLLRPEDALHVRELARVTGISPGTLHRELRALAELGLLSRRETGRQVFYSANRDAAVFKDLASLLRKTAGLGDVLKAALAPLVDRIRLAFVYGSMASGSARAHSDVDLMLLGSLTFAEVVKALHPAQATIGREINPTVMSVAEFNRRRRERDGFVTSVSKAPKIWLFGDDDDFAKLGKDRSTKSA
jgi:DNA-binding transcriptional ArsR family regulator